MMMMLMMMMMMMIVICIVTVIVVCLHCHGFTLVICQHILKFLFFFSASMVLFGWQKGHFNLLVNNLLSLSPKVTREGAGGPGQLGVKGKKGKDFPYSLPSVGPRADPGVQAVSLHVTISHPPGGGLPLLSARLAVTFPAAEHHRPLTDTKLYCLVTEAHRYEQLPKVVTQLLHRVGFEPTNCWSQVLRSTVAPPRHPSLHGVSPGTKAS